MNTLVTFDTLAYANKLKAVDIPPAQAEAQAEAMRDILESVFHTAELATKSDIALVKKDMGALKQSVNAKIDAVEQRLNAKMDAMMNKLIIRLTGAMIVLATVTGTIVTLASKFGG